MYGIGTRRAVHVSAIVYGIANVIGADVVDWRERERGAWLRLRVGSVGDHRLGR